MITMFDSVTASALPRGNFAYAGYVNGRFANIPEIKARFPNANVLSIAVFASADADCLDIEQGDATPAQAAGWVARQFARGVARPCLYASVSVMNEVVAAMHAAGVPRESLRLWSAHYTFRPHICGPATCRLISIGMDGTQWTDQAAGGTCDESLLTDSFFDPAGVPPGVLSLSATQMEAIMNNLPVLQHGDVDFPVRVLFVHRLQQLVAGIGAWNGLSATTGMAVDGDFGPQTAAAVKAVQKFFGLAQDGIVGPATWSALVTGS